MSKSQANFRSLIYALCFAWGGQALAGQSATPMQCSTTDSGAAVLNEIKTSGGSVNPVAFIEIKTMSDNVDITNWQICIDSPSNCETLGIGNGVWDDGIGSRLDNDSPYGNSVFPINYWITYSLSASPSEDEIILLDENGDVIDYVHYVKGSQNCSKDLDWDVPSACGTCFQGKSAGDKDFARVPDGGGGWGNNGDAPSPGSPNDGSTPPLPQALGEWWFDEFSWSGNAGEVIDQTANGLHLTSYNSTGNDDTLPALTGDPGSCRYGDFNGSNNFLQVNDSPLLDLQSFTAAVWIYPHTYPSGSNLKTIISKDENFEFHLTSSGEIYWWWGGGARELITSGANIPLNQWTHIAVTQRSGEQAIYINGNRVSLYNWTGTLFTNNDPFQVGQDQNYAGRYFDGFIDELKLYDRNLIAREVRQVMQARHPCPTPPAIQGFEITHDGNALNCFREAINIRAIDSSGNTVTTFAGQVNLSVSTAHGEWFITDDNGNSSDLAQGTLNNSGAQDGNATYNFAPSDNGTVTLYLLNTFSESADIDVAVGSLNDNDSEGLLTFRPTGFLASPVTTQIAGRPFNVQLTAVGQQPDSSVCRIISEYTGNKNIHFWSSYTLPATSPTQLSIDGTAIATSEPLAAPQAVNFNNGVATLQVQYNDVGQISFSAKDETGIGEPVSGTTDEIVGGIAPFIVRPFAYHVLPQDDPIANDENDPVYKKAGEPFNLTLRSVLWQSMDDDLVVDGIPDSDADLSDNGVTPSIVNLPSVSTNIVLSPSAQVVVNDNGALSDNQVSFSEFGAIGSASEGTVTFTQSWTEAGILTIDAVTSDFMGSAEPVTGIRPNIGRFTPDNFLLTITDNFEAQCGSFSYSGFNNGSPGLTRAGQVDSITIDIQARNMAGGATRNYDDVFAKLESGTLSLTAYNTTLSAPATGTINSSPMPTILFDTNGSATGVTIANIQYQIEAITAPLNIRVDLDASDSDGVSGTVQSTDIEQRLGRLQLQTSYGPENQMLEMPLFTEYFNGSNWLVNSADSCTLYSASEIQFIASSYQGDLNAGETSVLLPVAATNVTNGQSAVGEGIWFSAPGVGNSGEVNVEFNLTTYDWLAFDWTGDGNKDNPQATIGFGRYRGSDRVIYWREN